MDGQQGEIQSCLNLPIIPQQPGILSLLVYNITECTYYPGEELRGQARNS